MVLNKETLDNLKKNIGLLLKNNKTSNKIGCGNHVDDNLVSEFVEILTNIEIVEEVEDIGEYEVIEIIEEIEIIESKTDENGCHQSQIDFAEKIYDAWIEHSIVIAKAAMQFGKSGTIYYLANKLLANHLNKDENIIFMTSMSDTALLTQNQYNLQRDFIDEYGNNIESKIIVVKMIPDFKNNVEQIIKHYNAKFIIFDECDYGSGEKSVFSERFFKKLKKGGHDDVKVLLVSATPYCALHAVNEGNLDAGIVEAKLPPNYFGVQKMLDDDMIIDINNIYNETDDELKFKFKFYEKEDGNDELTPFLKNQLDFLGREKGGAIGIVRAKNSLDAQIVNELSAKYNKDFLILHENYNSSFETISVGVRSTPIKDILSSGNKYLAQKVINSGGKVLLIVVNALSAGKDLGKLKEYVRLVIETRTGAIANGSQGLVGRICGYHNNRNIRIIASLDVLRHYAKLEADANVISDPNFINETVALGIQFSTQLFRGNKTKDKIVYKQMIHPVFHIDDVKFKSKRLLKLFPKGDDRFGTFEELERIVNGKQTKANSHINSQRRSKYVQHPKQFTKIFKSAENGNLDFGNAFHRFRSEKDGINDAQRLRITRGIIFDDTTGQFFVIDRLDDGEIVSFDATVRNKSCYNMSN